MNALRQAKEAHGEFEENYLGERDEHWAEWYAAFIVGRYPEFDPSVLTQLLIAAEEARDGEKWARFYADYVLGRT